MGSGNATGVSRILWRAVAVQRVSCILLLCPSCTHKANRASFFTLLRNDSAHLLSEVGANFHAVSTCQHLHRGCRCLRRGILGALRVAQQTHPWLGWMDVPGYAVSMFTLGTGKPMIGILAFVGSRLRWDAGMQGSCPPICLSRRRSARWGFANRRWEGKERGVVSPPTGPAMSYCHVDPCGLVSLC